MTAQSAGQPPPIKDDSPSTRKSTVKDEKNIVKSSRYNVYFEVKGKKYALFNTLSRALLAVDQDLKDVLEKGDVNTLPDEIREQLVQMEILVPHELDERSIYEYRHCVAKYRSSEACFVIFPTYNCNLQCPYCYEGTEKLSTSMDDTTIKNTIDFIKRATIENESKVVIVGFYGGEPLLYPETCYTIAHLVSEWAAENNIIYFGTLTTNGTLLNEKTAQLLLPYVQSVHITLDGTEAMHNTVRVYKNGKGSYTDVMRAVELMRDQPKHLTVRIHVDVQDENYKGIEVLDELEQKGLRGRPNLHIYFQQLEPPDACLSASHSEEHIKKKERELNRFPEVWKKAQEKGWGPHMNVEAGSEHGILRFNIVPCDHLKKAHYVVDPCGDVYLCPMSAGFKHHSIGKIKEGGILTYSPSYYTLLTRDPVQLEGCSECSYLPICSGGCPISMWGETHDYVTPYCGSLKRLKIAAIKSHLRHEYPNKFAGVL
jgi:uncharacterized protein